MNKVCGCNGSGKSTLGKEIRIQRVKSRSFQKFGKRILLGGDLYEKEKQFFDIYTGNNGCP